MNNMAETILRRTIVSEKTTWKKNLIVASSGHFVNDFYNGFLAPLLPIIVVNLNLSLASAGLLFSIFSISNSLIQPIVGIFADRLNRNYFVLIGPMLAGSFMSLIGWVDQYWTLLLILCMSGIGTAMFHPQAAAIIGSLNNNRKGLAMSIFNTAGALGVTIGSIAIIPLTTTFGLKSTIVTIFLLLIFFFFSFNNLMEKRKISNKARIGSGIIEIIKKNSSIVLKLHLIVVIRATLTLAFAGFIPLYLTSQGSSNFFGALGLAVFQFFSVTGMLIGGHVFDLIGAKKLLILSFVFILPFAVAFINLPSIWGFPFLAIMGFLLSSSTAVNIILGQRISPNNVSFMSAVMMGLGWGIAGLLMTPLGALADVIGLYGALTVVSAFSLVGLILVYVMKLDIGMEKSI